MNRPVRTICRACNGKFQTGGAKGLCSKCYARARRNPKGLPTAHQPKELDGAVTMSFRLEKAAKTRLSKLAEARGVSEGVLLREAVAGLLARS